MTVPLFVVDAFTAEPVRGNPAGVCLLEGPAEPAWMQAVAAELGASETAFAIPITTTVDGAAVGSRTGGGRAEGETPVFSLRWFTPTVEVPLCGHATLATAHVLWESGLLSVGMPARFATASGELVARRDGDGRIEMDFPALPVEPAPVPDGAEQAIGAPVVAAARREDWLILEVGSEADVRALRPDLARIGALQPHAVAVTALASSPGIDIVSRVFAPNEGIDEDPVTGSAHCALAPYWTARLGRTRLVAWQASARGGVLTVTLAGDRVLLAGQALTVVSGSIVVG